MRVCVYIDTPDDGNVLGMIAIVDEAFKRWLPNCQVIGYERAASPRASFGQRYEDEAGGKKQ